MEFFNLNAHIIMPSVLLFLIIGICFSFYKEITGTSSLKKKLDKENKKTSEFLDDVKQRAQVSVIPESLEMIFNEIRDSKTKYFYNNENFKEAKEIQAYLKGKYHALIYNS